LDPAPHITKVPRLAVDLFARIAADPAHVYEVLQPQTPNSEPQTQTPKPYTLHIKSDTRNP